MKIKKGDKLFKKDDKEYLGEVTQIREVKAGKFFITGLGGEFEDDVITLNDLIFDEWLTVGMELDCSIVGDWYNLSVRDYLRITGKHKIEKFGVEFFYGTKIATFKIDGYHIPLVGFGEYYRGRNDSGSTSMGVTCPTVKLEVKEGKMEKGKWYKHKYNEPIVYCLYNGKEDSVGFFSGDVWGDHLRIADTRSWELVDLEKVEVLLEMEAKRKFPAGTKFKSLETGFIQTIEDVNHKVFFHDDETTVNSGRCPREEWHDFTEGKGRSNPEIFRNGKWAEVVTECKFPSLVTVSSEIFITDMDARGCENCKFKNQNKLLSNECYGCKYNNVVNKDNWISRDFEIGKWYKAGIVFILYLDKDSEYQCGIRGDKWDDKILVKDIKFWDLAKREDFGTILLDIAKKKFPVRTRFKNMESGFVQTISKDEHSLNSFGDSIKVNSGGCPNEEWYFNTDGKGNSNAKIFDDGKWAEIVDSNKLELGNVETKIVGDLVWTDEGSVERDDWVKWHKILTEGIENGMTYFKVQLNGYETVYNNGWVDIGCIKQISLEQIENVTNAIKKIWE